MKAELLSLSVGFAFAIAAPVAASAQEMFPRSIESFSSSPNSSGFSQIITGNFTNRLGGSFGADFYAVQPNWVMAYYRADELGDQLQPILAKAMATLPNAAPGATYDAALVASLGGLYIIHYDAAAPTPVVITPLTSFIGWANCTSMVVGDLNANGTQDVVGASRDSFNNPAVVVALDAVSYFLPATFSSVDAVALVEFDATPGDEIVVSHGDKISIYSPTGTLLHSVSSARAGMIAVLPELGAIAYFGIVIPPSLHVLATDFSETTYLPASWSPRLLRSADLDNDDDTDLIARNHGSHDLFILRNQGQFPSGPAFGGVTTDTVSLGPYYLPGDFALGDLDHDGDLDILSSNPRPPGSPVLSGVTRLYNDTIKESLLRPTINNAFYPVPATPGPTMDLKLDIPTGGPIYDELHVLVYRQGGFTAPMQANQAPWDERFVARAKSVTLRFEWQEVVEDFPAVYNIVVRLAKRSGGVILDEGPAAVMRFITLQNMENLKEQIGEVNVIEFESTGIVEEHGDPGSPGGIGQIPNIVPGD